jgi:hypothetical protein
MPICPIINGHIVFVYTGTDIDKSNTGTDIYKTNMSIKNWKYRHDFIGSGKFKTDMSFKNWTYWHVFISTGKDKTNKDINPHVYIGLQI